MKVKQFCLLPASPFEAFLKCSLSRTRIAAWVPFICPLWKALNSAIPWHQLLFNIIENLSHSRSIACDLCRSMGSHNGTCFRHLYMPGVLLPESLIHQSGVIPLGFHFPLKYVISVVLKDPLTSVTVKMLPVSIFIMTDDALCHLSELSLHSLILRLWDCSSAVSPLVISYAIHTLLPLLLKQSF